MRSRAAIVAGHVEAVGENVSRFQPGDEVFGSPFGHGLGAFAEWVCVSDDLVATKPANLSFDHAAAVPVAALTALQGLRDHGQVKPGERVLIIGASGGVGTFAVQIASAFGAAVTGVCSTRNVDLVRSLGADHVIDYTRRGLHPERAALRPHLPDRGDPFALRAAGARSPPRGRSC